MSLHEHLSASFNHQGSVESTKIRKLTDLRPMDAVLALYSDGHHELTETIIASLSRAVFANKDLVPAGSTARFLSRISYRILKSTTTCRTISHSGSEFSSFHNRLLEHTAHPYAKSLLASSSKQTESLVEGGDPMNGPYMMLVPEIRQSCTSWDRRFFNSVQGWDVQLRFIWETQATYDLAKHRLENGESVKLKALAAGTGLSMILAYDRLVRDGYDPKKISVGITDREKSNTDKSNRLLAKLASTRDRMVHGIDEGVISAVTEDAFLGETATSDSKYDVVTAIGILEYLQGFTCDTTELRQNLPESDEAATAARLAAIFEKITTTDAALIVNTYMPHSSTRILELFGKKFDYRNKQNLSALMATANFRAQKTMGSGNIYDVVIYGKEPI